MLLRLGDLATTRVVVGLDLFLFHVPLVRTRSSYINIVALSHKA